MHFTLLAICWSIVRGVGRYGGAGGLCGFMSMRIMYHVHYVAAS